MQNIENNLYLCGENTTIMEIEGKIILDLPLQEGTSKAGNHWQKKEWVLETINTQYPRKVKFDIFGDRATQMNFEVGKIYTVSFDLESREFNGRWYTDVRAYAMRESGGAVDQQQNFNNGGGNFNSNFPPAGMTQASNFGQAPATPTNDFGGGDATDDLPF